MGQTVLKGMKMTPTLPRFSDVLRATADRIRGIRNHPTGDIVELLSFAGLDPTTDLVSSDLAGIPFGTADVAGWDFSGAALDGSDLSQVQNIEQATFSPETTLEGTVLPEGVTADTLPGRSQA